MVGIGWKEYIEGLGVLALVASLLFVGYQLQQDRKIAGAQVTAESAAAAYEMFALMSDSRDIWLRGLKGEDLSEADEIAFKAIAIAIYTRHFYYYQTRNLLQYGSADLVVQQYAFDLYQYPALRRVFNQEGDLIDTRNRVFDRPVNRGFRAKVKERLAELDRASPELPERSYFPY
ncbi:MAG: hypothetical protein QNJ11_13900 [Woeseiaceae bacterium]|nr:hypothetical protein [Woeseiaceae bacterium]